MKLRFVFDTNALISAALLKKSVARKAFDTAQSVGAILASEATIAELSEVLWRPKFDRYLSADSRLQLCKESNSLMLWNRSASAEIHRTINFLISPFRATPVAS